MNWIKEIFKGILIGVANIIPGVSGGTMMVSMGIYDKIISSITNLGRNFIKSIKTLLPYFIGMAIGIVGLSFFIEGLFERFPFATAMAFVGLIFGGIPMMLKKTGKRFTDPVGILLFLLFFALIIIMEFAGNNQSNTSLVLSFAEIIKLFAVGIIAAATMVIPGVSGAMVLLILGYYSPILNLLNETIMALKEVQINILLNNAALLLPFGIGVLLGIFAVAKLLEYLLKNYERRTYYAILGLIAASPVVVLMEAGIKVVSLGAMIAGILTFLCGFVVAFYLGRE